MKRKRNKIIAFGLICAMSLPIAPMTACAQEPVGVETRAGEGYSVDSQGLLHFAYTDAIPDFEKPEDQPWAAERGTIRKVVIPDGMTSVGQYAFVGCSSLESVTLGRNVERIGQAAFNSCTSLTTLTIPDSVKKIDAYAFTGCTKLDRILHPDGREYTADEMSLLCDQGNPGSSFYNTAWISTHNKIIHTPGEVKMENQIGVTCTTDGSYDEVTYCSVCGKAMSTTKVTVPAIKHVYGEWETEREATVLEPEVQIRRCVTCGVSETQTVGEKLEPTVEINASSIVLKAGQSTRKLKISGLANGDSVVSWSSNTPKVARVSKTGKITAKKTGTAVLTVRLASGATKTIKVKVQKEDVTTRKITGVRKKLTLKKGRKAALKPVLNPITSSEKITYKSSNKKVVSVSANGRLTAKKKGKATITVTSGKVSVKCRVTVK